MPAPNGCVHVDLTLRPHEILNFSIVGEQKGFYQLAGSPEDLTNTSNYIGPIGQTILTFSAFEII